MTTACNHFQQQISKALLDDLAAEERQDLEAHLAECPACRLEQELYATTVRQLQSTGDVPVPRHFFVYPETRPLTPWRLFHLVNLRWRIVAVAASTLLVVGLGLLVANVNFRTENGVFSISFGKAPLPRPVQMTGGTDAEVLKRELLTAVEAKLQIERHQLIGQLQSELKQTALFSRQQQRQLLDAALERMETRFNDRLISTSKVLEARNDRAFVNLIAAWQTQREQDLLRINANFDQMTAQRQLKETQTDSILSTLIQVAELKTQ